MKLIHLLEPLWWVLFGAGGFVAALLLPGLVLGLFVLAPLGVISPDAVSHARMLGLVAHPIGRVVVAAIISLVLWHSAHHLRHFALDLGLQSQQALVSYVVYGLALLGTLAAVGAVAGLQPLS